VTDEPTPAARDYDAHQHAARKRHDELTQRRLMAGTTAKLKAAGEYDPEQHWPEEEYPPLTVREHLEILATGASLAFMYGHPAAVHNAVTAGAAWPQVAAALAITEDQARADYRKWADGQHWLSAQGDLAKFAMSDADHAAAIERAGVPAPRVITLDLSGEHDYFVITDALEEWAAARRREGDDDEALAGRRRQWADAADALRERIESALDGRP
jgi:hypothetical protein